MKIREAIAERIYWDWNRDAVTKPIIGWTDLPEYRKQVYRDWVDEFIFAIREDGCRLAIVKEEGELPQPDMTYEQGQQDMLNAGYVQEVVSNPH